MANVRLLLWMSLFAALPAFSKTQVFYNGRIPLSDAKRTTVDWVAVTDGKVVGYGIEKHFESYEDAEKIDLRGKRLAPKSRLALGQDADFLN